MQQGSWTSRCLPLQVPGDVLQGLLGYQTTCQPFHKSLLHDAGLRHARAAVLWWHRLHPKDLGAGQNRAGGPRLFHEANEWRSPWRMDHKDGLDLSHHPTPCPKLSWHRSQPTGGIWGWVTGRNKTLFVGRTAWFMPWTTIALKPHVQMTFRALKQPGRTSFCVLLFIFYFVRHLLPIIVRSVLRYSWVFFSTLCCSFPGESNLLLIINIYNLFLRKTNHWRQKKVLPSSGAFVGDVHVFLFKTTNAF